MAHIDHVLAHCNLRKCFTDPLQSSSGGGSCWNEEAVPCKPLGLCCDNCTASPRSFFISQVLYVRFWCAIPAGVSGADGVGIHCDPTSSEYFARAATNPPVHVDAIGFRLCSCQHNTFGRLLAGSPIGRYWTGVREYYRLHNRRACSDDLSHPTRNQNGDFLMGQYTIGTLLGAPRRMSHGYVLAVLSFCILSFVLLVAADVEHIWFAVFSISAFAGVLILFPACRPSPRRLLTPWNWTLLLFCLQLVLEPLSVAVFGAKVTVLPYAPSADSMNAALALYTIGFVSCAVAYQLSYTRLSRRSIGLKPYHAGKSDLIWPIFIATGLLGVYLFFDGFANYLGYLIHSPASVAIREASKGAPATLDKAAGTFLFPFLGFGLIGLLFTSNKKRARGIGSMIREVFLLALVAVSYAAAGNYNRGTFVVPLVAAGVVLIRFGGKGGVRYIVAVCLILATLVSIATLYREANSSADDLELDASTFGRGYDILDAFQVYGAAPQHLGLFLQETGGGKNLLYGTTILPSILYTVPVLGIPLRPQSTVQMYWDIVGREDQIVPFHGELFVNFHIPGIVVGLAILGVLIGYFEVKFERSLIPLDCFIWQYVSMWTSFILIANLMIVSEIYIYQFWPIYVYWFAKYAKRCLAHHSHKATANHFGKTLAPNI
jgi:hypothetical protein